MFRILISCLLLICNISIYAQDNKYLPKYSKGEVIYHSNYILSYSKQYKQSYWVAYELTDNECVKNYTRKDNFIKDPKLSSYMATENDYKYSGYDKGHLAPVIDMLSSKTSMYESFYMTNISPQKPSFNRGIWKTLETQVHEWAIVYDKVYIITGAILNNKLKCIGNGVAIPNYYYKIVLREKNKKLYVIAFILKNSKSSKNIKTFIVSVDKIESLTGIDFFPNVNSITEKNMEKGIKLNEWKFK